MREIQRITPDAQGRARLLELRELGRARSEEDMPNSKLSTDRRQLRPWRFSPIERDNDPILLGDGGDPSVIMRARRESIEDMENANLLAVETDQFPQSLCQRPSETLVEEKLRGTRVHAANASDS